MGRGRNIFIVAGEVSGDMAAASLAAEILRLDPAVTLRGIGGPRMAAAGVTVLVESSTWSAIGHVDPLLRLRTHLRRLRQVEELIRRDAPAVLLLVDFAAFNLRLAELLRGAFPVVYYFPPMVSVRRGNRAAKVARLRMRLLATLQREADAYRAAGADVEFVGHPAVDVVRPSMDAAAARRRFGVPADAPVVGLMPGSRSQEIRAHLPVMLAAARTLLEIRPALWFLLPVPTDALARLVEAPVTASGLPVRVVPEIYDAMAASDVLVAATGTATLEAAVLGVPMVAVYHLPWLSYQIAKRIASVPYAALPNILARQEIVPELLQGRMRSDAIAETVRRLLDDPTRRAAMRAALRQVAAVLGPPGAAARAARHIVTELSRAR
ncbi:MAG: lipid-A-disaccharide synthase [Bacillati bacterium ANGP1]|uniref:Lipid-A-disaccharide synthase n=1 Tax=Candidatus Segetimicrobium genomatis TaxID=2569760 RepID=A0A537IX90_9BACT|nr:MAG: lipid-A-disaccharide synthase [Terrabacteria group bacterium ANGP1]